jgi:hypothetical protein
MIRKLCLAVVALFLLAPASADAFWPYLGYGGYGPYGWGYGNTTQFRPAPPYFALHPPVYYSPHITARHYGASPFAWPAGMQPITYVPQPQPVMIVNPNAAPNKAISRPVASMDTQPLEIANPFFVSVAR